MNTTQRVHSSDDFEILWDLLLIFNNLRFTAETKVRRVARSLKSYGTLTWISTWIGDHPVRSGVVNLGPFVGVTDSL